MDNRTKLFGIMCLLVLLPGVLAAPRVLEYSFTISKEGEITKFEIQASAGKPKETSDEINGTYEVVIENEDGETLYEKVHRLDFVVLSDPPMPSDVAVISDRLDYLEGMSVIKLLRDGERIFSRKISFCNSDNVCDENENYLSCPEDCPLDQKDGICIDSLDGTCDPDCVEVTDKDCDCGDRTCQDYETLLSCPQDCGEGVDDFCNTASDDKCDPDCADLDPDCAGAPVAAEGGFDWSLIIILLIIVAAVVVFFLIKKRREGEYYGESEYEEPDEETYVPQEAYEPEEDIQPELSGEEFESDFENLERSY